MTNSNHPSSQNAQRPLLPDEPAPVDDKQRELTERYLLPFKAEIFDLLMDIRLSLDPALSAKFPQCMGKPYPLGRCLEITNAVRHELLVRLATPRIRAEAALRVFLESGGILRSIWGALRGKYFQNATQIGGLYVDVSNDTVDVNKPKIEICLMEECDLVPIRNIRHFIEIATQYWSIDIYVNSVVPSLAPLLPMIGVHKSGKVDLIVANDYMFALSMREQFRDAERWLAEGPLPTENIMKKMRVFIPAELISKSDKPDESIYYCVESRKKKKYLNDLWINKIIEEYIKIYRLLN
ncbi:hypothetical protein [Niveispirillum cyanobacteriorum]|uniref:Uncharacterized protein n=1 Tax=Niveispirillum cyanobacteriorum TaxID=1612173 RepID=A0A2K9NNH3_9PROT|nr:hypothetical protein [Niveispirillum cyanobacteriorum]AUN33895.1 hypothetical protein C0V82_26115 [Niveispirillum cyanobacteriorum]GGE86982.1 hypothetical protein GCM10011317_50100 [Niveispirillum cyanobacteriorum]